jgi:hypothetical protein
MPRLYDERDMAGHSKILEVAKSNKTFAKCGGLDEKAT